MNETATAIRNARHAAGLSAEALAARAGVSRAWLLTIERAPALASPELLARLARALKLNVAAFTNDVRGAR